MLATGCFPELSSSAGDASLDDAARDTSADVAADAPDASRDVPSTDAPLGDAASEASAPDASTADAVVDAAALDASSDGPAPDAAPDATAFDASSDGPAPDAAPDASVADVAADRPTSDGSDAAPDAPPTCATTERLCAGRCVNTDTDNLNCGSCGTVCATGQRCNAGLCMPPCATGLTLCGITCVDTRTSSTNCGACGRACTTGQTCTAGACVSPMVTAFAAPVSDHQLSLDGTMAMIGRTGNDLLLRCQRADGSLVRADQTVATSASFDTSGSATQVRIGGRSNTVLVTWMVLETPGNYSTRQYYARVYDSACAPVTDAFRWPSIPSGEYVPDVAMARDGRFVLAWKQDDIRVGFYSARGALEGQLTFPTRSLCPGGGYGLHVALNPETGDGIVTCQQHQSNPIYYQRFSAARALVDAAPVRVAQSDASRSSWYESHVVGMNADGAFAIEWQDATARSYVANFYDRTGTLQRTATLAPITESIYWDGFRQTHQAVELLGADWVLRTGQSSNPAWALRYSVTGARLGCATVPTTAGAIHTLRANGATTLTTSSGTSVRMNPVSLSDATGCP